MIYLMRYEILELDHIALIILCWLLLVFLKIIIGFLRDDNEISE